MTSYEMQYCHSVIERRQHPRKKDYQNPFPFYEIPDERMKIILDLEIVPVAVKNIEVIREHYPQLWNDFVLSKGADDLISLMDTNEVRLTESELASLLEDSRIMDSIAENMLFIFFETVSLRNKKFSNFARARIIEAHLDPEDVFTLQQLWFA